MKFLSKLYMGLLLAATTVMLIWGLAGFLEYFTGIVPIIKLQNDAYPRGVQFVHWLLITTTGAVFLIGYLTRWRWTPFVAVLMFSNLSVLCTIQTFDFMSDQWGITPYTVEMFSYVVHSVFLLSSKTSRNHFKHFQ